MSEEERLLPTKKEMLESLDMLIQAYDRLPPGAGLAPVTHSDFSSVLSLLLAILRAEASS